MVEEWYVGNCLPKYVPNHTLLHCRVTIVATVARMPNFTHTEVVENVLKNQCVILNDKTFLVYWWLVIVVVILLKPLMSRRPSWCGLYGEGCQCVDVRVRNAVLNDVTWRYCIEPPFMSSCILFSGRIAITGFMQTIGGFCRWWLLLCVFICLR